MKHVFDGMGIKKSFKEKNDSDVIIKYLRSDKQLEGYCQKFNSTQRVELKVMSDYVGKKLTRWNWKKHKGDISEVFLELAGIHHPHDEAFKRGVFAALKAMKDALKRSEEVVIYGVITGDGKSEGIDKIIVDIKKRLGILPEGGF